MTTYASAPGTRLGERYRLEDRIAAGSGWDAWKAIDETLARAVTVFTFASGFPRIGDVVTAARAASRLTDPRLAQVFDVEDAWDHAYIVMEWAAGETLGDLVSQGPLEPFRAARMIAEAAGALSSAHGAGVAHMCLSPGSVRLSPTGEVKVVGLGIDAALSGTVADDPVLEDTDGLGRLLYVALTGCWPGPGYPPLPPAPVAGGELCSPRQVVAGIPLALSDLTCRAMQLSSGAEQPLTAPGELARALVATLPPAPLLAIAGPPSKRNQSTRSDEGSWQPEADRNVDGGWRGGPGFADTDWSVGDGTYHGGAPRGTRRAEIAGTGRRSRLSSSPFLPVPGRFPKSLIIGIGVGVLALAAIAGFALWPRGGSAPNHPSSGPSTPLTSATVLGPAGATGFDPLTSPSADPGNENSQYAKDAIDNSPQTSWTSQWYASSDFGRLKAGSGLLIDMGKPVKFATVTVTFNSQPGASVKLLVGDSAARSKQNLDSMTQVASAQSPTGSLTFRIKGQPTGRYLVVWFTKLPPQAGSNGKYEAEIFNVAVRGTLAGH
jgi:serine/threonine protein kinase